MNIPRPDFDDDDTKDYLIRNENNAQWSTHDHNNENNNNNNSFYSFKSEKRLINNLFPEIPVQYLHHSFPYIYPETVIKLMRNQIKLQNCPEGAKIIFVDCRFSYEYNAGHINTAYNLLTFDDLISLFNSERGNNVILIFHCELTIDRSVKWAYIFRNYDRYCSGLPFPQLAYPNIYLLKGGFRDFYAYTVAAANNNLSMKSFSQRPSLSAYPCPSIETSSNFQSQNVGIEIESSISDIIQGQYLMKDDGFQVFGDDVVKESQALYINQTQKATMFLNAQCAPMLPSTSLCPNHSISTQKLDI